VRSEIRLPAGRGQGATVHSPRPASRARARVVDVFIATSLNETLLPDRLRRCETPPPPNTVFSMPDVPRWPATPTLLSACRPITAAPRCVVNSAIDAARGPRADTVQRAVALARARNEACAGTAAGFRPALPVPVARNSAPIAVRQRRGDPHTRPTCHQRTRLHAAPSVRSSIDVRAFGAIRPALFTVTY
jgi:hypothetical protein